MRDPRLIDFAKSMRRAMTEPEIRIWLQLRGKRLSQIKFRRQHVLGRYIADFYSREAGLVIEIDGDTHGHNQSYDAVRTNFFKSLGLRVLRFTNQEVMTNLEGVICAIEQSIHSPLPTLSPEGERAI